MMVMLKVNPTRIADKKSGNDSNVTAERITIRMFILGAGLDCNAIGAHANVKIGKFHQSARIRVGAVGVG